MKEGGLVIFNDNGKKKIIDISKIKIILSTYIKNILLVDNLKRKLLSIISDKSFKVVFESSICMVTSSFNTSIKFVEHRLRNIYMVDLNNLAMKSSTSLVVINARIKETS